MKRKIVIKNSMVHWDGHQCCAIDLETTGLDCNRHEIIQFSVVPLTSNFDINNDILPFNVYIKPENPELINPKILSLTNIKIDYLSTYGISSFEAIELFEQWVEKLDLCYTKYGNRKKIIPLGQNYAFDRSFLINLFGKYSYDELFHYQYKDTMIAAQFINDYYSMRGLEVPYPHVSLSRLTNYLNIDKTGMHNSLIDCKITAEVYKKLCLQKMRAF